MESVRGKRWSSEHSAGLCTAKGQGPAVVSNQPTGQVDEGLDREIAHQPTHFH